MARTPTIESLAEEAAAIEAQADALRAEQSRLQQAEADRLSEHRAQVDAEILETGPRRAEHDAAVEEAAAELRRVIANEPTTAAMIKLYEAQALRRQAFGAYLDAMARTGRPTAGARLPDGPVAFDAAGYQRQLAEQAGYQARIQAEADLAERRDNPKGTPA